jgi:hypothetical protein
MSFNGAPVMAASVVAVDVGKNKAALSMTGADRHRLFGPAEFAMTAPALAAVLERVCAGAAGRSGRGWGGSGWALSPTASGIWGLASGLGGFGA